VGGLMDSAARAPAAESASIAPNSLVPEDFIWIFSLLPGHHTTFPRLACKRLRKLIYWLKY
jgi:hypothetical protein